MTKAESMKALDSLSGASDALVVSVDIESPSPEGAVMLFVVVVDVELRTSSRSRRGGCDCQVVEADLGGSMAIVTIGWSRWSVGSVMILADALAAEANSRRLPESPVCRVRTVKYDVVFDFECQLPRVCSALIESRLCVMIPLCWLIRRRRVEVCLQRGC